MTRHRTYWLSKAAFKLLTIIKQRLKEQIKKTLKRKYQYALHQLEMNKDNLNKGNYAEKKSH